jgi:hypothetical protein
MNAVTILELAITAAACGPAVRLAANRSTRLVAPGVFLALVTMVGVFAGGMLYLGVRHPAWLHAPALVAAVLAAVAWWRARVDFGAKRQLAPGSMSLFRSLEAIVDRHFYRDRFERHGPIFKMAQFHHRTICVLGLDLGHRILRERADSLGPTELAFNREIDGGFLRYMDANTHRKYGPLFRAAFSPAVVEAASPAVGATLRGEIETRLGGPTMALCCNWSTTSSPERYCSNATARLIGSSALKPRIARPPTQPPPLWSNSARSSGSSANSSANAFGRAGCRLAARWRRSSASIPINRI